MTKQELIAYLDAVCDAESAVQACEDAILVCEHQKQALRAPLLPDSPVYETPSKTDVEESDTYGKGAQILSFIPLFMHNASAAQLDAHFSEANRQLSAINNSLAISEHNRYIERRLNNVDTYLMKFP